MNRHNYEYGTNPRKIEPNYKRGKKQNKNDVKTRIKRNEEVRKQAMKLEKKLNFLQLKKQMVNCKLVQKKVLI